MADAEDEADEAAMELSPPTPRSANGSVGGSIRSSTKSRETSKSGESGARSLPAERSGSSKDVENRSIRSLTKSTETSKSRDSGERSLPTERSASSKDVENRSIDIVKSQEELTGSKTMDEIVEDEIPRQSLGSEQKSQEGRRDSDVSKRSSEVKEIKLLPKARTSSRLTTSIQQHNQRRFREMIGKRELRNEELGKQKGDLRHRLDLLECSVPAVMLWNIWRMSQGAPVSSIQRVMKKQFLGPASGEAYCPTTPSRHYDCRVREAEADRKLAEKRASEARTVLSEKQKLLDAKKQKLDEAKKTQQERQEKIEQLTKQAKELKEAIKEVEQDGSCIAGECGDIECKRRLLARMSSSSSIRSTDVECLEKLQQLAESELMMKRQIEDLERREETYMKTLQQADDLWAKVEGDTASTMSALQELLDVKATRIQQLEDQLKDQLTKSAAYKSELQKYVSVEKIEAAIGRDDDLAQVYDKSIAAKVKLKHRITGGEIDMAEKETLARIYGKDESVSAVIAQVESSVYARPDLADLGTDIPEDLIAKVQEQMGIKSEDITPEEKYRQAMLYLDQIGSLSKLYDQDDWKICDPEQACQQYETSTEDEQLISVTSLVSKTGESFHGKTSKDIGLAPTSQEAPKDLTKVESSSKVDTKNEKSLKSILSGKETPKKTLEKDGRTGPTEYQLRSWLDATNVIRTIIENCPECQIAMKEADGLAKDIASYTGSERKPELKEDPRAETKVEIELEKTPQEPREKVEKVRKEEVRADELKISKSNIPREPDDRTLRVKDSDGTVKEPRVAIEEESPSPKEVVKLDKVPVEKATKHTEVSSEKPLVKEVGKKRIEESAVVQRELVELEEVPVEVMSASTKDIPAVKESKMIQEVTKVTEIATEPIIESPITQEKIQKSKAFHEEVVEVTEIAEITEVKIEKIEKEIQESEDVPEVINIIEVTNEAPRVVIQVSSSSEKLMKPPPTPTDLKARAAASVTSTPEEIALKLEEHLSTTPEEIAKGSTEMSDIIKDVKSESLESKVEDEIKLIVEDLIPRMLEEELEIQPEEKEVKVFEEAEVKLEEINLEEAQITKEEIELEKPEITSVKSELEKVEIIRVDSEPLLPKLSKVIEVEETESQEVFKRMGEIFTGPEVACKPYLAVADIEISKPEKSQPELKQPCPCNVLELGLTRRELARREKETMEIVTQTSQSVGVQTIPVQKVIKRLDVPRVTTHREGLCQLRLQDQSTITVSSLGIQTDPYGHPGDIHKFDCTCCVCATKGPPQVRPEPPPKEVPLVSKMPIMLLSEKVNVTSLRTDQEVLRERLCTECKIKRLERQRQSPVKSPRKDSCEAGPCGRILKDMRDQSSMARIPKPPSKYRSKWKEPNIEVVSKTSSLEGCTCYDLAKKLSCKCGDPFMYELDV